MKKGVRIILLIIFSTLIISGVLAANCSAKESINNINKTKKVAYVKKKSEEKKVDDNKVIEENNIINNEQPVEEVIAQPITYNRITINGVLDDNLMKDATGEHFYLSHDINGNYDGRGVPYIDFRNNFNGRKTIIYAHSSTAGNGPFQALQNYHYNKGYYDSHRYITINYEGNTYTYLIFSVYVSVADNDYSEGLEYFYNMDYSDEEWQEALNRYKLHSEYDTGVNVNSSDRILILQTCSLDPNFYERYYRYNLLIMGKLI